MFQRRRLAGDLNAKRFWTWFAGEAQGLRNGMEALARGEADAGLALDKLNIRIRRYHPNLEADVVRGLDGLCELQISGGSQAALVDLTTRAPRLAGWRITSHANQSTTRRVPFLAAPRPSMDLGLGIQGRHEAYA